MKKVTLFLLAMLCTFLSFGQTDDLRSQLDYLFGNLNAAQVPSGYLAPYGLDMADKEDFNGLFTDSNIINHLDIVRMVYADVATSRFYSGAASLPSIDAVNTAVAGASDNALLIFFGQYSIFREDAVQQNLLQYTNGQLFDVAGRSQNPYVLQNTFAAYPKQSNFSNGVVTLQFNPSLYYTNTGAVIQSLQADFGSGFQTISVNSSVSHTYTDSTGMHLITLKAQLSNGSTQYTRMAVYVRVTPASGAARYAQANLNTPDIDIAAVDGVHSGARIYIRRSMATPAGQILRPLIVVEGLDVNSSAPQFQANYNVNNLIDEWGQRSFNGHSFDYWLDDISHYDLVFVDWNNGTDDITHNATLLEDIIGRINTMKANSGSAQQNVVMGISMGGLVTRYCLASMTKRGINPQTRLLITHDSPHQGSYVPLAFEHLVLGLQNTTILGVRLGSIHHGALDEAVALLQSPAAQQELVMAVADANGNVTQNTFLATTYRDMITFLPGDPQPQYQFIATAQGSQCGISPLPVGATLASGSASGNTSGPAAFITHGIIARWKYYTEINASGLTGNANHQILHFLMQRLQRLFFGLINNNKTIALLDRYEPAFNNLPWESIPGGVESLADRLHTGNSLNTSWSIMAQWFLGYNYSFTLANRWGFLPVFSALDVTTPITTATIYNTYLHGITPAGVSRAADFIAQEQFGAAGSPQYNQPHTTFTARNAEWIYDQMQGIVYIDCFRDCAPGSFSISGNNTICTNENYVLTATPAGTGVTWSASPQGVVNIVANGTQATISAITSGNVTITATVTNNCTGQTSSASKSVRVGGYGSNDYPVSGPSSASCGQYLYFSTNDLPGATNYQWFWPSDWTYAGGQGTRYLAVQTPSYNASSGMVGVQVASVCDAGGSPAMQFVSVNCYGYYAYSISPNPATSEVSVAPAATITNQSTAQTTITEVNIYDQTGILKKQQKLGKVKKATLNISNLPYGVYIIEIVNGTYKERQQLSIIKY